MAAVRPVVYDDALIHHKTISVPSESIIAAALGGNLPGAGDVLKFFGTDPFAESALWAPSTLLLPLGAAPTVTAGAAPAVYFGADSQFLGAPVAWVDATALGHPGRVIPVY